MNVIRTKIRQLPEPISQNYPCTAHLQQMNYFIHHVEVHVSSSGVKGFVFDRDFVWHRIYLKDLWEVTNRMVKPEVYKWYEGMLFAAIGEWLDNDKDGLYYEYGLGEEHKFRDILVTGMLRVIQEVPRSVEKAYRVYHDLIRKGKRPSPFAFLVMCHGPNKYLDGWGGHITFQSSAKKCFHYSRRHHIIQKMEWHEKRANSEHEGFSDYLRMHKKPVYQLKNATKLEQIQGWRFDD